VWSGRPDAAQGERLRRRCKGHHSGLRLMFSQFGRGLEKCTVAYFKRSIRNAAREGQRRSGPQGTILVFSDKRRTKSSGLINQVIVVSLQCYYTIGTHLRGPKNRT
jgi:hypothetical protein